MRMVERLRSRSRVLRQKPKDRRLKRRKTHTYKEKTMEPNTTTHGANGSTNSWLTGPREQGVIIEEMKSTMAKMEALGRELSDNVTHDDIQKNNLYKDLQEDLDEYVNKAAERKAKADTAIAVIKEAHGLLGRFLGLDEKTTPTGKASQIPTGRAVEPRLEPRWTARKRAAVAAGRRDPRPGAPDGTPTNMGQRLKAEAAKKASPAKQRSLLKKWIEDDLYRDTNVGWEGRFDQLYACACEYFDEHKVAHPSTSAVGRALTERFRKRSMVCHDGRNRVVYKGVRPDSPSYHEWCHNNEGRVP